MCSAHERALPEIEARTYFIIRNSHLLPCGTWVPDILLLRRCIIITSHCAVSQTDFLHGKPGAKIRYVISLYKTLSLALYLYASSINTCKHKENNIHSSVRVGCEKKIQRLFHGLPAAAILESIFSPCCCTTGRGCRLEAAAVVVPKRPAVLANVTATRSTSI